MCGQVKFVARYAVCGMLIYIKIYGLFRIRKDFTVAVGTRHVKVVISCSVYAVYFNSTFPTQLSVGLHHRAL